MVKTIAIVGTSRLAKDYRGYVRDAIFKILKKYDIFETKIISGGAEGVDKIAIEIAKSMNFSTRVFNPNQQSWLFYAKRNVSIAKNCDKLYCITTPMREKACYHHKPPRQDHEKTAGCWTLNKAKEFKKETELVVVAK